MMDTLWVIYRSERPVVDEVKAVEFVQSCVAMAAQKLAGAANVVGVHSTFPAEAEAQLVHQRLRVVRNLPAWAKGEVWVGRECG